MSLVASYVLNHLLPAFEEELLSHAPEAQEALLAELKQVSDHVVSWLNAKIADKAKD